MGRSVLRYIPNGIAVLRLILVLPIVFLIIKKNHIGASLLLAIGDLSDGLDGFIARQYKWISVFGKLIDPLADKQMIMTNTLTLGLLGQFPVLLMVLVIVQDLTILGGVFCHTILPGFLAIEPSFLGKCTTSAQIFLPVCVLLSLDFPSMLFELFLTYFSGWSR